MMAVLAEACEGYLCHERCPITTKVCRTQNERKDNQRSCLVSRTQPGGHMVEQCEDAESGLTQNDTKQLCGRHSDGRAILQGE